MWESRKTRDLFANQGGYDADRLWPWPRPLSYMVWSPKPPKPHISSFMILAHHLCISHNLLIHLLLLVTYMLPVQLVHTHTRIYILYYILVYGNEMPINFPFTTSRLPTYTLYSCNHISSDKTLAYFLHGTYIFLPIYQYGTYTTYKIPTCCLNTDWKVPKYFL